MENFEYRWVGRLADGFEWDSGMVPGPHEAQDLVTKLQAAEDASIQADEVPEEDRVTYSIERRPIPPKPEWEPYNPTSGEES